jgi:hypothetical protein
VAMRCDSDAKNSTMPSKQRTNLQKVLASLNTLRPKCGYQIPPNETQRVTFAEMTMSEV